MSQKQNTPPDVPSMPDDIGRLDDDGGAQTTKADGNPAAKKTGSISQAELDTLEANSAAAAEPI